MSIIGLPGWNVTGSKSNKDDYRLTATYGDDDPTPECPKCSTLFGKVYGHGTRVQFIMDLPAHNKRVGIDLTRKRYRCQNCDTTFLQDLPDVDERSQMTRGDPSTGATGLSSTSTPTECGSRGWTASPTPTGPT